MPNTFITLPYCCGNNLPDEQHGFWSDALKRHLEQQPDQGIRIGAQAYTLANLNHQNSLDYWLRSHFVRDPDRMQAVQEVIEALINTGDFETREIPQPGPGINPTGIFLISQITYSC